MIAGEGCHRVPIDGKEEEGGRTNYSQVACRGINRVIRMKVDVERDRYECGRG